MKFRLNGEMTGWSYVVSAFDLSWRSPRNGERRIAWSYVIIPFVNWIANCHCIRLVWFLSWYKYLVLYSFTFAPQCWIGGGLKFHFSSIFFQPFFLLTQARQGLMSNPAFLLSMFLQCFYCCSCGSFCRVSLAQNKTRATNDVTYWISNEALRAGKA